jgi:hypothetical protein
MKCSNPNCNHGIGLMSYRRGWIDKGRYCSKTCRDTLNATRPQPLHSERRASTYFEWLFLQPVPDARLIPAPALARVRTR